VAIRLVRTRCFRRVFVKRIERAHGVALALTTAGVVTMRAGSLARALLVLSLLAIAPSVASAQRLGAVSAAVHGGGGGGFSGGGGGFRSSGGYSGYRGGYGHGYGYGGYGAYGGVQASPWVSLYFPYYAGYAGTMVRHDAMSAAHTFDGPSVVGVVDASAGYVFDGVVRGQVSGRIRITDLMDVEARYGAYFEQTGDAVRELGIGRVAIAFPFVNEGVVQLRGGVAGQLYHDVHGVELGYAGLLELDAYPVEPLVIHAEASIGALGQAVFVDARATVGIQIDRGELYVGYQVFAVDPLLPGGVALHGPVAGVRVWIS